MIFKTERCIVRELNEEDFNGFHEMQKDPEVMKYTSGKAQTLEESRQDFDEVKAKFSEESPTLLIYSVTDKNHNFLGTCALVFDENGEFEIGYRFKKSVWGLGYASEITKELVNYCFNKYGFEGIYAYCFTDHKASSRVLEKVGFKFLKEFLNEDYGLLDRKYVLKKNAIMQ